jgi:hypothetical protein
VTSAGAWTEHYTSLAEIAPYGGEDSYRAAAQWTADCVTVSDRGCGAGSLRKFIGHDRYRGIDGSPSPFADEIADLTTYRHEVEGVVLRHVLEHELGWRDVLDNAVADFQKRLFIALFTPLQPQTVVLATEPDYGDVPVIGFRLADLTERFGGLIVDVETVATATFYGTETLLRIAR